VGIDLGTTKLFADGADREGILEFRSHPLIEGFTTNPTLMRAAGVEDYESFAIDLVGLIPDRPISFEVFSDDADGMISQAQKIATWGEHVHVKIPITDTKGTSTRDVQHAPHPNLELLWASPREILNVVQAAEIGCHVITLTRGLLEKLDWLGRDLGDVSLDTVRMFRRDAELSGYSL
jgi:transaldolase